MAITPIPFSDKLLLKDGEISEPWKKFLTEIGARHNPYVKFKSSIYTASTVLTAKDLGRVIKVDNGALPVTITLPSVNDQDVDTWITILRLGTGWLTIQLPDSDTIEKSSQGGKIVCREVGRICANITLCLASSTKWAISGGTGIWHVY